MKRYLNLLIWLGAGGVLFLIYSTAGGKFNMWVGVLWVVFFGLVLLAKKSKSVRPEIIKRLMLVLNAILVVSIASLAIWLAVKGLSPMRIFDVAIFVGVTSMVALAGYSRFSTDWETLRDWLGLRTGKSKPMSTDEVNK